MGTKNNTTSTNQYNQPSLNDYQTLATQSGAQLGSQISNPYNNSVINGQRAVAAPMVAASRANAGATSANQMSALGTSGGSSYSSFAGANLTRFNAGTTAQANNNLLLGAVNNRNTALGSAMSFRPLQTGGTQVQSTTGSGTWVGAAVGAAGAGLSAYQAASNASAAGSNGGGGDVPNGSDDNGMSSFATSPGEEGQFSGGTGTGTYTAPDPDAMNWGGASPSLGDNVGGVTSDDFAAQMPDDEGAW
jgi:hypothetical protein